MNTVHLADCLPAMREMRDKQFDLAIVDPPFNQRMSGGKSKANGFKGEAEWMKFSHGWNLDPPGADYFTELRRVSKNQIVWGANFFAQFLPPSMGWVFWYKMQDNFSFSDGEFAFTSFDCKGRIFQYARGNESGFAPKGNTGANIHPTQKPVALYKWLLANYAKPGQTILDTHVGSGSSRIACYDMGFDFVGYEIDKDYWEAQEQRFKNYISQERLPIMEREKPEQTEAFAR